MGGRHSKRSMDVTTTPKKDGIPAEGDAPAVGDGKLERIEEADANTTKPTTNGVAPHTDTPEDKDNVNEKESATEKDKEKDDDENKAADESKPESPAAESPAETEQVTTPTEGTPASPKEVTSPDTKEAKKKDKTKKKWSFRSISFSKKDKSKPVREDTPKNGDVSKEEPLTEGGEEGENATEAVSPAEDKSAGSPTDSLPESKDEEKVSPSAVTASPADENKEAPSSPAPTPVPEAKKEENEVPVEKVEVSPAQGAPVEVKSQSPPPQKISPPSIIERKTTEDFPSLLPSSPPPTPIDPSPLQQAQQAAPNATALAEALKPALNSNNQLPLITNESNNKSNESNESSKVIDNPVESDVKPEVVAPVIESIEIQELDQDVEKIPEVIDIVPQVLDVSESVDDVSEVPDDLSEVADVVPIVDSISETIEPTAEIIDTVTEIIELETESEVTELPDAPIPSEPRQTEDLVIETEEGPVAVSADDLEADVPPPLPESPIPVPKASADLMNFMASQISDDYNLSSGVLPPVADTFDTKISESPEQLPAPQDDDLPPPPPQPQFEAEIEQEQEKEEEIVKLEDNEVSDNEKVNDNKSPSPKSPTEDLLTPPASPNPSVESSPQDKLDKQEQQDKMNGYVYDKCEIVINDRLAETIDVNDDNDNKQEEVTTKDSLLQNHQSIPEVEAPVENNVAEKTETVEEENKSPVPPVVSEPPASLGPAITEDVTSVTKAVEEIDINEKAVAAAVNENIEAVNKNEIIAEMNHQNNLNE